MNSVPGGRITPEGRSGGAPARKRKVMDRTSFNQQFCKKTFSAQSSVS